MQTVIVLNFGPYVNGLKNELTSYAITYNLDYQELEEIYDWCVIKAFRDFTNVYIGNIGVILDLPEKAINESIYHEVRDSFMTAIGSSLWDSGISLRYNQRVKITVANDIIILIVLQDWKD